MRVRVLSVYACLCGRTCVCVHACVFVCVMHVSEHLCVKFHKKKLLSGEDAATGVENKMTRVVCMWLMCVTCVCKHACGCLFVCLCVSNNCATYISARETSCLKLCSKHVTCQKTEQMLIKTQLTHTSHIHTQHTTHTHATTHTHTHTHTHTPHAYQKKRQENYGSSNLTHTHAQSINQSIDQINQSM